jgi:hypothetical protein
LTDELTAPIIYLEDIYQQYLKGITIDEIIGQIEMIVRFTRPPVNVEDDYIPSDNALEISASNLLFSSILPPPRRSSP